MTAPQDRAHPRLALRDPLKGPCLCFGKASSAAFWVGFFDASLVEGFWS